MDMVYASANDMHRVFGGIAVNTTQQPSVEWDLILMLVILTAGIAAIVTALL